MTVITNPFVTIVVCSGLTRVSLVSNVWIDLGSNLEHPFFQFPFELVPFELVKLLRSTKPPKYYWLMNLLTVFIDVPVQISAAQAQFAQ